MVQRPGDTVVFQKNVGHLVLTVSGIPEVDKEMNEPTKGAALLTSKIDTAVSACQPMPNNGVDGAIWEERRE